MRLRPKSDDSGEGNIFWITMTDLMTALVLVFMILFFYTYVTSYYDKIKLRMEQERSIYALGEIIKQSEIKASVDTSTGVVKISDLSLFNVNSWELSPQGKEFLTKFTPIYFDSLFENEFMATHVDKIIIQGHTDSQTFAGKYSADEQYMKNMELSLKRALAVAEFMTNTPYNKVNGDKLRKMIVVEGASYSNPILVNGKEDFSKSRRVELKFVMKGDKNS